MENIVDSYYAKLGTTDNIGRLLADFYGEITSVTVTRNEVIMCNRLITIFGRFIVFFSILDLGKYQSEDIKGTPYPLLFAICKSRYERTSESSPASSTNLNKILADREKEIDRIKNEEVIIPDSTKLGEI